MSGSGDTAHDARQELQNHFASVKAEKAKTHNPLPRPGTRVPIEFTSREQISAHAELEKDFVRRVLDLEWAWISDESSLWDFHDGKTNEPLISRIRDVYGVDVSDIKSGNLSEILGRIAAR
jgi:hypothetical protein